MQKTCQEKLWFKKRITSFTIYWQESLSHCATTKLDRVSFHKIIPTLPIGRETEKYSAQGFDRLYCPIESFQIKAVLFPPFAHHIPAAAQRGCSDALISHTGQHRGQHTRTSPPSFIPLPPASPLYSPLINTPSGHLTNPITLFVRISLCGFSGSRE